MEEIKIEHIGRHALPAMTTFAREKTWQAVADISQMIRPGMTEKQATQKANAYFAEKGVRKFWHKTHVRFGHSTTLSFDDPYADHVVLKENDIFFIDIGPVFFGHEADCGQTFVLKDNQLFSVKSEADAAWAEQSDYYKLKLASEKLFLVVANKWKNEKISGAELYEFAAIEAEKMGYQLNLQGASGHRIGDFPHAVFHKGALNQFKQKPQEQRWILEIQLRHPQLNVGAFFEDIL